MTAVYSYVVQTAITVGVSNIPFVDVRSSNEKSLSVNNVQRPNLIVVPQASATITVKQSAWLATLDNTNQPIGWIYVPQTTLTASIKNNPFVLLPGTATATLFLSSLVDPESPEPTPVPQPEGRFYWG